MLLSNEKKSEIFQLLPVSTGASLYRDWLTLHFLLFSAFSEHSKHFNFSPNNSPVEIDKIRNTSSFMSDYQNDSWGYGQNTSTYVLKYKHTTVLTTNMLGNLGHNMVLLLRSLIINDISDDQQLMGLCSNATVKLSEVFSKTCSLQTLFFIPG